MAHAQAKSTLQESDIMYNTDEVEEDLLRFDLRYPMNDSDLQHYSQEFDDSDDLLMQS